MHAYIICAYIPLYIEKTNLNIAYIGHRHIIYTIYNISLYSINKLLREKHILLRMVPCSPYRQLCSSVPWQLSPIPAFRVWPFVLVFLLAHSQCCSHCFFLSSSYHRPCWFSTSFVSLWICHSSSWQSWNLCCCAFSWPGNPKH